MQEMTGAELLAITGRTLFVSVSATVLAAVVGIPAGYALARTRFRGSTVVRAALSSGMGLPPVVVGLIVWLLLTRSGPLGGLGLIYTKSAMIIAQAVLSFPIITVFVAVSMQALPAGQHELLELWGASRVRRLWLLIREARMGVLTGVVAGFGAVISEVGAAMAVGGNLRGSTRVLTTAIVTSTGRGEVVSAVLMGILLWGIVLLISIALLRLERRR